MENNQINFNLIYLKNALNIKSEKEKIFKDRTFIIATAGYSSPPEGYETITSEFLQAFVQELGRAKTGLVTSPTSDKGSIDAMTTIAAQKENIPLLYITAKDYIQYINPYNFPEAILQDKYINTEKYVFPSPEEYSKATAESSDILLITGGRSATVSDFVNAVKKKNKVIILDNKNLGKVEWNEEKNRPNNGALYIIEEITAFRDGKALPYPDCGGLTYDFLEENYSEINSLIKVIEINCEDDIIKAAAEASEYIKKETD